MHCTTMNAPLGYSKRERRRRFLDGTGYDRQLKRRFLYVFAGPIQFRVPIGPIYRDETI